MQYRTFGKTGLKVSVLGFGAMRLPPSDQWEKVEFELAVPMLVRAVRAGVNYIDSAYVYPMSEQAIALALKELGGDADGVSVSTKNIVHENKPDEWRKQLDESIERLGRTPTVLHIHDVSWKQISTNFLDGGLLTKIRRAQNAGLFRFLAFSSHDDPDGIRKIIDTGEFDSVTVQHNFLYTRNAEVIDHAVAKGLGTAVMGPLGGGKLVAMPEGTPVEGALKNAGSLPDLALRFVLNNPSVCTTLSGMSTIEQVEQNLATAEALKPLTGPEQAALDELARQRDGLRQLYCTGCGYCLPCPQGVDIRRTFELYNQLKVLMHDPARLEYNHVKNQGISVDVCIECGQCVPKCPQQIDIPERLKEAHKALTNWG